MGKTSLPVLAAENNAYLVLEAEKCLTNAEHPELLKDFVNAVTRRGHVSINIPLANLIEVLEAGHYMNMFELGYSMEEIAARYNRQQPYFQKLMAFAACFPEAKQAKYGLLNLGNMGSPYLGFGNGNLCIVLKQEFVRSLEARQAVVCLKKYSLAYFDGETHEMDPQLKQDLATYTALPELALLKHKHQIPHTQRKWADLVVNARGFIEIMLFEPIPTRMFEAVRCCAKLWDAMDELMRTPRTNLSLSEITRLELWKFMRLKCKQLGISLVKQC